MKLANNTISIGLTALVAEAFAMATASGVDEKVALDILEAGFAAPLVKRIRPLVEARRFDPDFKLSLAIKDIDLALAQAAAVGIAAVMTAAVREVLSDAQQAGAATRTSRPSSATSRVLDLAGIPAYTCGEGRHQCPCTSALTASCGS